MGSLRCMTSRASASACAAPPMSFFMRRIPSAGLMSSPPESKHTPLPTIATRGWRGLPQLISSRRGGRAAARPTAWIAGKFCARSSSPTHSSNSAPKRYAGQHARGVAFRIGDEGEGVGRAVEARGLRPATLDGRERFEEPGKARGIGGEDRDGLLEGLLVGDDGHPVILRGEARSLASRRAVNACGLLLLGLEERIEGRAPEVCVLPLLLLEDLLPLGRPGHALDRFGQRLSLRRRDPRGRHDPAPVFEHQRDTLLGY